MSTTSQQSVDGEHDWVGGELKELLKELARCKYNHPESSPLHSQLAKQGEGLVGSPQPIASTDGECGRVSNCVTC
jgi:hypothetical protein